MPAKGKRRQPTRTQRAGFFGGLSTGPELARQVAEKLEAVQRGADESTRRLADVDLLEGVTVTASLTTSSQDIIHKLGRKPLGWLLTDIDANATVWRTAAMTSRHIPLRASAACAVRLWVF